MISTKPTTPLAQIGCPDCGNIQDTANHKLRAKVGFGQMACQRCRRSTKASRWTCDCEIEWCRSHMHAHKEILRGASLRTDQLKSNGSNSSVMGTYEPLPKRARYEWNDTAISDTSSQHDRISLEPGACPKLAARFPCFVKSRGGSS